MTGTLHPLKGASNPLAILAEVADEVRADPSLNIVVVVVGDKESNTRWSTMTTANLAMASILLQKSVIEEVGII